MCSHTPKKMLNVYVASGIILMLVIGLVYIIYLIIKEWS